MFYNKKSQISIFIIVGIVIVLMLILVFILGYSFFNTTLRQNIISSSNRKSIATQVETTIQDCLEISADKALITLGMQGGYIYSYQGGLTELPITILNTNITRGVYLGTEKAEVPFWIIRDPYDNPPAYPTYNYYGLPIIVYLQPEDLKTLTKKPVTIKAQLENYARIKFEECFNISRLNESIRAKIYEKDKPKIKVIFSRKNTRFELIYPVIIYDRQMNNKVYNSNVGLNSIYNLARMLIEKDIKNLTFTFVEDGNALNPYKGTLGIQKISGTIYDIAKITDAQAKINNNVYEFIFLIQNRNPVLQNIPTIELFIGETYDFSPFAFDPDEDVLNLTIKNKAIGEEIESSTLTALKELIGVNYYLINVTDVGGLSDWQEDVTIKVMCEYYPYDDSAEIAMKISEENWEIDNKFFTYNPHCCNQNNYLSFRAGETAKMKTPDGTISECTCTDLGDCVLKGMTCTPNTYFCQDNNKCYCNADGTVGTCQTCPDFCSNGKCCFEECQEICETLWDDKGIPYEVCTTVCSTHCY